MPEMPPPLDPEDEAILRRAGESLVHHAGPSRTGARDAVARARNLARRRRRVRYGATIAVVAAVAAAIAVPLTVAGVPQATKIVPAHSGTTTTTTTVPATSTTTTVPATTTTTTVPPTTTTTVPPGTQVLTYDPFTATGTLKPTLTVTAVGTAQCVSSGVAGLGSYRCIGAQGSSVGILDPCFPPPGATAGNLFCPGRPTSTDVAEISVSSLPSTPHATATKNWAMQLADGQVCVWINAASGNLGPFTCQTRHVGQIVHCHVPVAGTPWWTASCGTTFRTTGPLTDEQVTKVWSYGLATKTPSAVPGTAPCAVTDAGKGIQPRTIFLGCATSARNLNHIHWTSWSQSSATGTATESVNNCTPDCAQGTFATFPVKVSLTTPGTYHGLSVFTRIIVTPTTNAGSATTTTTPGGWGFATGGS